jgi:hypothetical protein
MLIPARAERRGNAFQVHWHEEVGGVAPQQRSNETKKWGA